MSRSPWSVSLDRWDLVNTDSSLSWAVYMCLLDECGCFGSPIAHAKSNRSGKKASSGSMVFPWTGWGYTNSWEALAPLRECAFSPCAARIFELHPIIFDGSYLFCMNWARKASLMLRATLPSAEWSTFWVVLLTMVQCRHCE